MKGNSYGIAMSYEQLIRQAHRVKQQLELGADVYYMQNLIDEERNLPKGEDPACLSGLVDEVKGYIDKALQRILDSFELNQEERAELTDAKSALIRAASSSDLMVIVRRGLDAISRFR